MAIRRSGSERPGAASTPSGGRTEPGAQEPAARGVTRVSRRIGRGVDALYRWLGTNRVTRFPWAVIQTFSQAHGPLLSGSMAYYTFLSILPLLMLTGFVLAPSPSAAPTCRTPCPRGSANSSPASRAPRCSTSSSTPAPPSGIVGLVTVAYAGSGFVGALTACLNRMWGMEAGRNPVGQKLLNLGFVVLLGIVLLGSVGLTIWVRYVTGDLLDRRAAPVVALGERLAGPVAIFVMLLLLYRMLPARRLAWRTQIPGAVFAAAAVELLKRAFQVWAEHSAGVAALPRTLLSVVLLLTWFGFFGQAILYGAALNVTLERRRHAARES